MSRGDRSSLTQSWKWLMLINNDPKRIVTQWSQKNVLDFFKEHLMAYFDIVFVRKQASSLDKYKELIKKFGRIKLFPRVY
jgi:hypothetical protein